MTGRNRRKRITLATLNRYAQILGTDSIASAAMREVRRLERLEIRVETFITNNGFQVQTAYGTVYRFG